jgi:hypothetical protein
MPTNPTRTSLMRSPNISTPPPICRSKDTTVCAIKYGPCSSTEENEFEYDSNLTLDQCRALAAAGDPSHGTMYYRDKTNDITVIEAFNNCVSQCDINYTNCHSGVALLPFHQSGLTLAQCQAHQTDRDPASGSMIWTPATGPTPFIENFDHCVSTCQVVYLDCTTSAQKGTLNQNALTLAQCQAHKSDMNPAKGTMTWQGAHDPAPTVQTFSVCPLPASTARGWINTVTETAMTAWISLTPTWSTKTGSKIFSSTVEGPRPNACQAVSTAFVWNSTDPNNWSVTFTYSWRCQLKGRSVNQMTLTSNDNQPDPFGHLTPITWGC